MQSPTLERLVMEYPHSGTLSPWNNSTQWHKLMLGAHRRSLLVQRGSYGQLSEGCDIELSLIKWMDSFIHKHL